MADTDVRGKNAIESRIREEDTDEFVSLSEDKIQKKSFLSKIIKSIENDNKEEMNNKDKEVRTGVKKTGFAAKFADDDDNFVDQKNNAP